MHIYAVYCYRYISNKKLQPVPLHNIEIVKSKRKEEEEEKNISRSVPKSKIPSAIYGNVK